MKEEITHEGVITQIKKDTIEVTVRATGACGSCELKNTCISTESAEKKIIVSREGYEDYKIGDNVIISSSTNQGYMAVILVYVLPVILMVALYFISFSHFKNELISASISVGSIVIYYILIHFINPWIKNKVSFKLKHNEVY